MTPRKLRVTKLEQPRPDLCIVVGQITSKQKVVELEAGADRTTGKTVASQCTSGLPPASRHNFDRLHCNRHRPQPPALHHLSAGRSEQKFDWSAFVEVPRLVRSDAVPRPVLAFDQKKIYRRERSAEFLTIGPHYGFFGPIHAAKKASFRVRSQIQKIDQCACACVHTTF